MEAVYDSVGQATFEASLASLRPRGLMVLYGASSGHVPPAALQVLNQHGALYVTRPSLFHYVPTPYEVARAHTDLESGTSSGKLLALP